MPIEIRELVIRAVVDPTGQDQKPAAEQSPPREDVVAECVEQVLDILRLKKER